MKKLFSVLIVFVVVFVSSVALSADIDPIVGSWYMIYDKTLYPEFAANFTNCDLIISVYSFLEDGSIFLSENDITDKTGSYVSAVTGKWEKNVSFYDYSIAGFGSGKCFVDGDDLLLQINGTSTYFKFRRMIPFDFYTDYVNR